ncbi:MAG: hypothetical protein HY673_14410 [Chloroflexi bacterium]|nr:hypothetical protein [Chloroflexota bacterium]
MAKGRHIKSIERLIAEVNFEHPDWIAKEIRGEVENRVHKTNPRSNKGWPGLSAVQKKLTEIRKAEETKPPELKELDKPWSLAAVVAHPILSEALPVLFIQLVLDENKDTLSQGSLRVGTLTTREALWVARLHSLFPYPGVAGVYDIPLSADQKANILEVTALAKQHGMTDTTIKQVETFLLHTHNVLLWAKTYAMEERIAEIGVIPFDTSAIDKGLLKALMAPGWSARMPPIGDILLTKNWASMTSAQFRRITAAYITLFKQMIEEKEESK